MAEVSEPLKEGQQVRQSGVPVHGRGEHVGRLCLVAAIGEDSLMIHRFSIRCMLIRMIVHEKHHRMKSSTSELGSIHQMICVHFV